MYDTIVIGAGPAGCAAARALSEKGMKVLVVEKFKLPRYKSCSGQLIRKSLDLVSNYFGETVPDSVTCTPSENRGMIFTDDKGKTFRFEQSGLNVWRSSFDNWLAKKASESGAEIRDQTEAISVSDNGDSVSVMMKSDKIYTEQAKYVIDCEGMSGIIKYKTFGVKTPYIMTFQTFNCGRIDLDYHYFYAYLQPEFSEYDSWFNVKDNQLVLGVAVNNAKKIPHYYSKFISYMEKNYGLKIDEQLKIDKWIMPRIQPNFAVNYGVGRILFAGEIAGFLNPMGEGISAALESGHNAAISIINNFDIPDSVRSYYKNKSTILRDYMIRQWNLIARMTGTFVEMGTKKEY